MDYDQEVRFAVVMYGGVSLAVYMNGVAQELLRAVRATADLPAGTELDASERVYKEIGQRLFWGRKPGNPSIFPDVRTRIVVDILSGTSAGGINAVFLAKALARKSKDLENLKQMWLKDADINTLLNDAHSDLGRYPTKTPKASLLNSKRMYELLLSALNKMDDVVVKDPPPKDAPPLADQIDLFVTATDLNGLEAPIELTDKSANEKIYRMAFHFQSDGEVDHFTKSFNRMLAFAARCTSSFPVAFEPMKFSEIQPTDQEARDYRDFFERYVCRDEDYAYGKHSFADGGILDNQPFSYAIDAIMYRRNTCHVDRKLLFIDPSPKHASPGSAFQTDFNFLENGVAALVTLPGYQTIRGDIERVNERNRYLNRLRILRERVKNDRAWKKLRAGDVTHFGNRDLSFMVNRYGAWYAPCHHIKVFGVTDWLARLVTSVMGFNLESDEYRAIRQLLRVWREDHYAPNPGRKRNKKTENQFLLDFDIGYRLRRLHYIREEIDELLKHEYTNQEVRNALKKCRNGIEEQLSALFKHRQHLESRNSPIRGALQNPKISGEELLKIIAPPSDGDQLEAAAALYSRLKPMFGQATEKLAED